MKVRTAAALLTSALTLLVASLSTAQQAPRREATAPAPAARVATAPASGAPSTPLPRVATPPAPRAATPGSPAGPAPAPPPSTASTPSAAPAAAPASPVDRAPPGANLHEFDASPYSALPPGARVALNLQDADLPDLIRAMGNITGKRFIVSTKARAIKTTIYSPTRVTVSEAWQAFLSALRGEGMTVVPAGRFLRVEETADPGRMTLPTATSDVGTPDSDRYVTRIHRLRNLGADDAASLLSHFKSRDGDVTPHAATGTLILTDAASNVRRMIQILTELDVPATGEQIWVERVHHANASDLATRITETLNNGRAGAGGGGAPGAPAGGAAPNAPHPVRLIPDERTNALIVVATQREYLRVIELLRELDRPVVSEGEAHVHYLQNADAAELVESITQLVNGSRQAAAGGGGPGGGPPASRAGSVFEGPVSVAANKRTNSLLVTASPHDWVAVRRIIRDLDQERRQVFIDAVIVEMSVGTQRDIGVAWHGGQGLDAMGSLLLGGLNPVQSAGFPGSLLQSTALQGLALGVRGPNGPTVTDPTTGRSITAPLFGATLTAMAGTRDADVLAMPSVVATDNTPAEIRVGGEEPLQLNTPSFAAGATPFAPVNTNVQRAPYGTNIRIVPHVNDSDRVRLEIEEEISEVGPAIAGSSLGVRPTTKNTAKTTTTVRDGETVVIGGLIRNSVRRSTTGIPFLSDIPILGALFRREQREVDRRNLLLFLTPYIIRDQSDLRRIFERKMRERQEFLDRYFVFSEAGSVRPDVDYTRTNGLVEEVRQALRQQRAQADLEARGMRAPPPEHGVSQPIGAPGRAPVELRGDDGDADPGAPATAPMPAGGARAPTRNGTLSGAADDDDDTARDPAPSTAPPPIARAGSVARAPGARVPPPPELRAPR